MKRLYMGNVLFVALMMMAILSTLFLAQDNLLSLWKLQENDYLRYLNQQAPLIKRIDDNPHLQCQMQRKKTISTKFGNRDYRFHCINAPLFLKKIGKNQKQIVTSQFTQYIDMNKIKIRVADLSHLPITSKTAPEIVLLTQPISDKLTRDFYGVIITPYAFELKLGAKLYGAIYSPEKINSNTSRYISHASDVFDDLAKKYDEWHYLPYSRNILSDENEMVSRK